MPSLVLKPIVLPAPASPIVFVDPVIETPTALPRSFMFMAGSVPMKLARTTLPSATIETPTEVLNPMMFALAELAPPIVLPEPVIEMPNASCRLSPDESVPMKLPATTLSFAAIEIPDVVLYPMMLTAETVVPPIVLPELVIEIPKALVSLSASESVPTKLPMTRLPVPASTIPDVVLNPMMLGPRQPIRQLCYPSAYGYANRVPNFPLVELVPM